MQPTPRICCYCQKVYGCWIDSMCNDCKACKYQKCYLEDMTGKTICLMASHGICLPCYEEYKKKKKGG